MNSGRNFFLLHFTCLSGLFSFHFLFGNLFPDLFLFMSEIIPGNFSECIFFLLCASTFFCSKIYPIFGASTWIGFTWKYNKTKSKEQERHWKMMNLMLIIAIIFYSTVLKIIFGLKFVIRIFVIF